MTDKIILFLVEGPTDEDTLALIYSKIVKDHDIKFEVLHTDITADEEMTVKYIEVRIKKAVDIYLQRNPFLKKSDILKVIQIIDTDGAFVPSTFVKQSDTGKTEYFDTYISAKNKDRLIRRNISKRNIVYKLVHSEDIAGFPYEIYYFSRNIEHVLHNIAEDLTDEEKEEFHIIEETLDDKYKILYFPNSKRFFKVNDKAIELIKDISDDTAVDIIGSKYGVSKETVENYKKKFQEYEKTVEENFPGETNKENKNVLGRLVLHLANGCNLRCMYCYANGGTYHSENQLMDKKTVDQAIKKIYSKFDHILGIQLFGGEPLLNLDMMEYICSKFSEYDPEVEFGIVTNGTLINEQFIQIAKKYNIHTTISYDGDYNINNKLRIKVDGTGASNDILKAAKKFREETGLLELIEATYTQIHYDHGVTILDVLKDIEKELPGIPVHLAPAGGSEIDSYVLKDLAPFVDSVDEIFNENAKENNKEFTYSLMQRIVYSIVHKTPGSQYICDAGIGTLSISVKGDVYPCFMFTDQEEYRLGNIWDDNLFDSKKCRNVLKKIQEFNDKNRNKECNDCFIKNICNGCLGLNSMNTNSTELVMDKKTCDMFRKMTERVLVQLADISQKTKEGDDNF